MSNPPAWPLDEIQWPAAADSDGASKALILTSQLAVIQASYAADVASAGRYEQEILDAAKASIDRAVGSADTIQKAATAVITLYTGLLALAFSVSSHPLPARGLIPGFLLGLAIVLATAYVAYMTKPGSVEDLEDNAPFRELGRHRLATFITWTSTRNLTRSYLLRASVLALGASLAFLPAPFVTIGKTTPVKPATAQLTPWPAPPGNPSPAALDKYQAQLAETSALRTKELAEDASAYTIVRDHSEQWWWLAFIGALVFVFTGPLVVDFLSARSSTSRGRPPAGQVPEETLR